MVWHIPCLVMHEPSIRPATWRHFIETSFQKWLEEGMACCEQSVVSLLRGFSVKSTSLFVKQRGENGKTHT